MLFLPLLSQIAQAEQAATPGFPEAVVQWGAQKGETCGQIANALYGSPKYAHLLLRYNRISCTAPMTESITLIAPAKVTSLPTARLRSMHPDVQTRPPGGGWSPGSSGQSLGANHSVQTQESGRADIEFIDRSRVFLAPRTLVVIFDTAKQTRVSKVQPPRVEVQEGEVRAGLAALRGAPVEVSVSGGGQISAASRDTVITKKSNRTTVAVFDGSAGVTSAGKRVEVPLNHGTKFIRQQPPEPPRPLPPAPLFREPTSGALSLEEQGLLQATWEPVPNAASYRVEVARDEDFSSLLVREEVPADVTTFRGEQLPPGRYYLRVRAIDKEDFLGIAATRATTLVIIRVQNGKFKEGHLLLRRAPSVEIQTPTGVEIAADEGAFGPVPPTLSLPSTLPHRLRLRAAPDQPPLEIPVELDEPKASIKTSTDEQGKIHVLVLVEGRTPEEAIQDLHPRVKITTVVGTTTQSLVRTDEQHLGAIIPSRPGEEMRIEVVDDNGTMLGITTYREAPSIPTAVVSKSSTKPPLLVAMAPLWAHQTDAISPLRAPWATEGVSVAALALPGSHPSYQMDARGSGTIGPVGLDLGLRTRLSGEQASDGLVWTGARIPFTTKNQQFAVGGMLHGQFPTTQHGPNSAMEPALSLGGLAGRTSWVFNIGGRIRLSEQEKREASAAGQGFLAAGVAWQMSPWLRVHSGLDGRWLVKPPQGEALRAGGTLGVELGTTWFAGAAARMGLFEPTDQGASTVQLTIGFRDTSP